MNLIMMGLVNSFLVILRTFDLRALIFLKIKRATGTTTMSMDNLVLVPKLLMAMTCISI